MKNESARLQDDNSSGKLASPGAMVTKVAIVDELLLSRSCISAYLDRSLTRSYRLFSYQLIAEAFVPQIEALDLLVLVTHGRTEIQVSEALELTRTIPVPILVLTAEDLSTLGDFPKQAIRAGVMGFVSMANSDSELLKAAIEFVMAGGTFLPTSLFMRNLPEWKRPEPELSARLTVRESQVLKKLQEGKSNKIIARELSLSQATIKVHISNIFEKLGVSNRTAAALVAQSPASDLSRFPAEK